MPLNNKINLQTPQEICNKANAIDHKLKQEEKPRFSWFIKITNKVKEIKLTWNF